MRRIEYKTHSQLLAAETLLFLIMNDEEDSYAYESLGCIKCALFELLQLTHSYCKSLWSPPPASDSISHSVGINV